MVEVTLDEYGTLARFDCFLTKVKDKIKIQPSIIDINSAIMAFETYGINQLSEQLVNDYNISVSNIELMYMHAIYKDKKTVNLIPIWNFTCICTPPSSSDNSDLEVEVQICAIDGSLVR